jgi:5-methylcytosine-specific restriction protein A
MADTDKLDDTNQTNQTNDINVIKDAKLVDNKQRYMGKQIDAKLLPKNEDGLTCCRWCGNGVKPPKRTMCSKECVHELNLRINGRYLRDCVYKRDRGICALCNIDTKQIAIKAHILHGEEKIKFLEENSISLKRKIWVQKHGGGLWDADHIIPVKEGGGLCGLENIRTLCIKCHKVVTKSLASKNKVKKEKKKKEKNIKNISII